MRKLKVTEMGRLTVEEFRHSRKLPLTVVLDNVRSAYNVGSVLRTADAFRLERVVMCGITAVPPSNEIHKTALGAEDSVSWLHVADTLAAVNELKAEGYHVYAVEQAEGSTSLDRLEESLAASGSPDARYAIVLGNEVKGVRQDVVDACEGCIEIPQFGTKHSLNVSVAAGMVIWEFVRRWGIAAEQGAQVIG